MITIEKILGNEQYDEFIRKVNANFNQLSQLNGGPRGLAGISRIPGLPGTQGRGGYNGDNGTPGNRIFLISPDDTYTSLPAVSDLSSLVSSGAIAVGDSFIEQNIVNKVVYDNNVYKYVSVNFSPTSLIGDSWITAACTPTDSYIAKRTFLNYLLENTDATSLFLRNVSAGIEYAGAESSDVQNADASYNFTSASSNPIGIFLKKAYKLSISQLTLPTILDNSSFQVSQRFPNIYNAISNVDVNYPDIISSTDPSKFSDGLTNPYDYGKTLIPLLYLEGSTVNDSGAIQPSPDSYGNFGVMIQRINTSAYAKGKISPTGFKSILTIGSAANGTSKIENDIYLAVKTVWSDGSFISELNANTKNFDRNYTVITTKTGIGAGRQNVNYGHSTYFKQTDTLDSKLMTGFVISTQEMQGADTNGQLVQKGSLDLFIGNNLVGNTDTSQKTNRTQVLKIDYHGRFTFDNSQQIYNESSNTTWDIINQPNSLTGTYSDVIPGGTANFTFKSNYVRKVNNYNVFEPDNNLYNSKILQIIAGTNGPSISVYRTPSVFANEVSIASGITYTNQVHNGVNAGGIHESITRLYGKSVSSGGVRTYSRMKNVNVVDSGVNTDNIDIYHSWGLGIGQYPTTTLNNLMGIERNGSIANCFTWVKKSWNNSNASIVSQSESYVTMSDKTTVHNETGFLLHKGRLQMYIGDTPNDTSDLTGRIMTSMTSNGVAKWSKSQDVIGTYEYIDLLNIASPNVTIDSSKMLHMIMFDNISTGGTNLWTSYYDKSVNLILPNAGVDYDGNEHTFIFKANEIFGRLADATYMKITSADSSVLYQMTAKEK
jgi:hypothetical protein